MGPRCIVIDGYNVIRNVPALAAAERHGLAAGREALLAQVAARYRHTPHRVLVVFDGDGASERTEPLRCGVGSQVIFSASGESADAVIVRLVAHQRAVDMDVVVVSDDLDVRQGGAIHGATGTRVDEIARHLNAAPRHLERRARHHEFVRSRWERDGDHDGGPQRGTPRKGNAHRAPRRRRNGPAAADD